MGEKMETAPMETNFKKTKSKSESQCSLDLSSLFEVTKRSNGCTNYLRCRTNIKKAKILIGSLTDCVIEVYDEYSSNLVEKKEEDSTRSWVLYGFKYFEFVIKGRA